MHPFICLSVVHPFICYNFDSYLCEQRFLKTVEQNSIRLGTTVVWNMLLMNVVDFLKLDHSAGPSPGGVLNFGKNTEFDCSELDICGQGFSKTIKKNSLRLRTTILWKVLLMHIFDFYIWVL